MASRICYNLALFAATAAALSPLQISQTSRPLQQPQSSRRNLLAGAGGLAAFAVVETASAAETTAAQKEEIAKALEKAVSETAAAAAAGAEVTSKFLEDPATQKALKEAGDGGEGHGRRAPPRARRPGRWPRASRTAACSSPRRTRPTCCRCRRASPPVAATGGGDLGKAIDEWSKLPGVKELSATSGKTAAELSAAALSSANAALDGVKKRAQP
ncbi:asparagine-tRNA ligase [Aureococcus anophagefferens]|nr:asparagine-tRNA ligase [Aureococcus anophagefferens]